MKKQMKKITAMVLGLILFAGCMSPAQLTHAADGYSAIGIPYSKNMTISKNNYGYYIMSGKNLGYGEIMSIKSSNRKVIRPWIMRTFMTRYGKIPLIPEKQERRNSP